MERAVLQSNLLKEDIQPYQLLKHYNYLMVDDILNLLPIHHLSDACCPVTGEFQTRETFQKMGMTYRVSASLGTFYLSPRPTEESLKNFYFQSSARKYWLEVLWPKTECVRNEKIILPMLDWVSAFVNQYFSADSLTFVEYLANHWGYYSAGMKIFPRCLYLLVDPYFDPNYIKSNINADIQYQDQIINDTLDCAFLFEALDRSFNPQLLLQKVRLALKPGGLCFITCLLASGFEVQTLGQLSSIFVPPERMNLLTFEGMTQLVEETGDFEILEFSTPAVLDLPNVMSQHENINTLPFFQYLFRFRNDSECLDSFRYFLQLNRLGTFGRIVLRKKQ